MKILVLASMLALSATNAFAVVTLNDPWARATVPGQQVGAVYIKINSSTPVTLVHAETDVAKDVEVHTMSMHDGVMKMREHGQLDIPAGKTVELAPGGIHLMLLGLKKPLTAGDTVSLKMTFADAKKAKSTTAVINIPVRPLGQ